MIFKETPFSGGYEILYNSHYVAVPLAMKVNAKAGTPVAETGNIATGNDAYGVLLHDVDIERNPNGTVVIHGFINVANAHKRSGKTITAEMTAAMPAIKFLNFPAEE